MTNIIILVLWIVIKDIVLLYRTNKKDIHFVIEVFGSSFYTFIILGIAMLAYERGIFVIVEEISGERYAKLTLPVVALLPILTDILSEKINSVLQKTYPSDSFKLMRKRIYYAVIFFAITTFIGAIATNTLLTLLHAGYFPEYQ